MAYEKHNFQSGDVLHAWEMNDMDNQIASNEEEILKKVNKVNGKSLVSDSEIERLSTLHNYDDTDIKTQIAEVEAIAKGRATGYVFNTKADMDGWIPTHAQQLVVGDNLYIKATDVPDYWWDGTQAQELETQKVDLSEYRTSALQDVIDQNKVYKVEGKDLSTNDYSNSEKSKLANIEDNANNYTLPSDVPHDSNYVHTDNNYDTASKGKVDAIPSNPKYTDTVYDDTEIRGDVTTLKEDLVNLGLSVDAQGNVIDTWESEV